MFLEIGRSPKHSRQWTPGQHLRIPKSKYHMLLEPLLRILDSSAVSFTFRGADFLYLSWALSSGRRLCKRETSVAKVDNADASSRAPHPTLAFSAGITLDPRQSKNHVNSYVYKAAKAVA